MNLFITNIELNYDKELLLKEFDSAELIPYTPSRPIRNESWFSHQPDWLTLTVEDFTNPRSKKDLHVFLVYINSNRHVNFLN